MAPSDFMLRQRRLLEETKKNKGVPPIKSIYTPENYKPLTLPQLNNAPTGGQIARVNPMNAYDSNANKIDLDKTSPIASFITDVKGTAALRASISDPKKAFSATLPNKPTLPTLNNNSVGNANNTRANIRPDRMPGAPITMTNDGITGDTSALRANKNRAYGLDGINKQNSDGSFDTGNLNTKFDADTDPAAAKRFLAPTGGRSTFPKPIFGVGRPRPLKQASVDNSLPSKEGLNRHQYQQVLKNKGLLDVKKAANEADIITQKISTGGYLAGQKIQSDRATATQGIAQDIAQNKAQAKNLKDMKSLESKNLKTQYDMIDKQLEDFTLSDDERLKLQKQRADIGKLLRSSLQTPGQIAQRKAFEDKLNSY